MILRVSANSGVSLSVVVLRTLRLNRVHLSYYISFLNQALTIEDSTIQFGSKFHAIYIENNSRYAYPNLRLPYSPVG